MARLLKAFFYKISKDITFRIVLIIGFGFAIFTSLMYFLLGGDYLTGQSMLLGSFSVTQNFGISIPICLISFIYLEFTQGIIRNKIIAGHSKAKVYASLYLSGLVFTLSILGVYVLTCFGIGCIFGGFDPNGFAFLNVAMAKISPLYILKFLIMALITYSAIVSFTVFVVTLFRNMGPSIPVVLIVVMGLALVAYLVSIIATLDFSSADITSDVFNIGSSSSITSSVPSITSSTEAISSSTSTVSSTTEAVSSATSAISSSTEAVVDGGLEEASALLKDFNNVLKIIDPLYGISGANVEYELENGELIAKAVIDNATFFGCIATNLFFGIGFYIAGMKIFQKRDVK